MKTSNADTWFSRYIRLRDAWESNGVLVNKCATSDKLKVLPCKELECGHFISRRHMSVRFDERNAMPQSTYENRWKYGNPMKMAKVIDSKFGEGTAELLETLSRTPTKVNEKLISDYYREKVNELLKAKNWTKYKWW